MMSLLQQGGLAMWPILGVGALWLALFLQRLYHLHRAQIKSSDFLRGIFNNVEHGHVAEAVSLCDDTPGPVAQLVRAAILEHRRGDARLAQVMEEVGLTEIARLERNLTLLLTLAQALPMLGLLGTVLGLMQVLMTIQKQAPLVMAGDLAGGMWQALLTTAAALALAIPAYASYNFLVTRVESIVVDMERVFAELLVFFARISSGKES